MIKIKCACRRVGTILCFLASLNLGIFSAAAARLQWNPNPEDSIAFYTVYAESELVTLETNIIGSNSIDLGFLQQGIVYTLYVTATSTEGLESERSEGVSFGLSLQLPSISLHPTSTNAPTGSTITLSVDASNPLALPLTYQWFKDGNAITGATSKTFSIANAAVADSGNYHAIVSNLDGGVQSAAARLVIQNPARILVNPMSAAVPMGSLLVLSVGASGSDLRYQWFRDEEPLLGATNSTLSINGVSAQNAGPYSVNVSNLVGVAQSSYAQVTVWPAISILQQPTGRSVLLGGQLRLSVAATGPEPLTYQWYRGSAKLTGQTASELVISPVDLTHGGLYTVRITSIAQTIVSSGAQVNVVEDSAAADCLLSMSKAGAGQLSVAGIGPANASFELQFSDNLRAPRWVPLRTVNTGATGRFETLVSVPATGNAFVRAARK